MMKHLPGLRIDTVFNGMLSCRVLAASAGDSMHVIVFVDTVGTVVPSCARLVSDLSGTIPKR